MGLIRTLPRAALLTIGLCTSSLSFADALVPVGNGVFKTQALEKLIRGSIASSLEGTLSRDKLNFRAAGIDKKISLPPLINGKFKLAAVLKFLSLKNDAIASISPIQAKLSLPDGALKLNIQNKSANSFLITANWSLNKLNAKADSISFYFPPEQPAATDQGLLLKSTPMQISLKGNAPEIKVSLTLTADLNAEGAKFKIQSFRTNLNSENHPEFSISIGKLTANGAPADFSIQSNGKSFYADEPTLRSELQSFEKVYADTIRIELANMMQTQISSQLKAQEASSSLNYKLNSDEALSDQSLSPSVKNLIGGIDFSFVLSYLQSLNEGKFYSAQIASQICFDGQCVVNASPPTAIGGDDLQSMPKNSDASLIVYESFLQNLVQTPSFQKRVAAYFKKEANSPGVELSQSGMRFYFDPSLNAVVAILNLEIDIKKTSNSSTPFGVRIKRNIADWIEAGFGSGKLVKIPVPLVLKIKGLVQGENNDSYLSITTDMPSFGKNGQFDAYPRCTTDECPNNVDSMTHLVRKSFIPDLKAQFMKAIPHEFKVPMGASIKFKSMTFKPKTVSFTPNRGLMISVGVEE